MEYSKPIDYNLCLGKSLFFGETNNYSSQILENIQPINYLHTSSSKLSTFYCKLYQSKEIDQIFYFCSSPKLDLNKDHISFYHLYFDAKSLNSLNDLIEYYEKYLKNKNNLVYLISITEDFFNDNQQFNIISDTYTISEKFVSKNGLFLIHLKNKNISKIESLFSFMSLRIYTMMNSNKIKDLKENAEYSNMSKYLQDFLKINDDAIKYEKYLEKKGVNNKKDKSTDLTKIDKSTEKKNTKSLNSSADSKYSYKNNKVNLNFKSKYSNEPKSLDSKSKEIQIDLDKPLSYNLNQINPAKNTKTEPESNTKVNSDIKTNKLNKNFTFSDIENSSLINSTGRKSFLEDIQEDPHEIPDNASYNSFTPTNDELMVDPMFQIKYSTDKKLLKLFKTNGIDTDEIVIIKKSLKENSQVYLRNKQFQIIKKVVILLISNKHSILVRKYELWELPIAEQESPEDSEESTVKKSILAILGMEYLKDIHLILQDINRLETTFNINNRLSKFTKCNFDISIWHVKLENTNSDKFNTVSHDNYNQMKWVSVEQVSLFCNSSYVNSNLLNYIKDCIKKSWSPKKKLGRFSMRMSMDQSLKNQSKIKDSSKSNSPDRERRLKSKSLYISPKDASFISSKKDSFDDGDSRKNTFNNSIKKLSDSPSKLSEIIETNMTYDPKINKINLEQLKTSTGNLNMPKKSDEESAPVKKSPSLSSPVKRNLLNNSPIKNKLEKSPVKKSVNDSPKSNAKSDYVTCREGQTNEKSNSKVKQSQFLTKVINSKETNSKNNSHLNSDLNLTSSTNNKSPKKYPSRIDEYFGVCQNSIVSNNGSIISHDKKENERPENVYQIKSDFDNSTNGAKIFTNSESRLDSFFKMVSESQVKGDVMHYKFEKDYKPQFSKSQSRSNSPTNKSKSRSKSNSPNDKYATALENENNVMKSEYASVNSVHSESPEYKLKSNQFDYNNIQSLPMRLDAVSSTSNPSKTESQIVDQSFTPDNQSNINNSPNSKNKKGLNSQIKNQMEKRNQKDFDYINGNEISLSFDSKEFVSPYASITHDEHSLTNEKSGEKKTYVNVMPEVEEEFYDAQDKEDVYHSVTNQLEPQQSNYSEVGSKKSKDNMDMILSMDYDSKTHAKTNKSNKPKTTNKPKKMNKSSSSPSKPKATNSISNTPSPNLEDKKAGMAEYENKLNEIILNSEIRSDTAQRLDVNQIDIELDKMKKNLEENKIGKRSHNDIFLDSGNLQRINSIIKSPDFTHSRDYDKSNTRNTITQTNTINNNHKDKDTFKQEELESFQDNNRNLNSSVIENVKKIAQEDFPTFVHDNLLYYMNVRVTESESYTVDVMDYDSALSVVQKAADKHFKKTNKPIANYDKVKYDLAEMIYLAIKEWNDGETNQDKLETLKNPLFNQHEITQIKLEMSAKISSADKHHFFVGDTADQKLSDEMYEFEDINDHHINYNEMELNQKMEEYNNTFDKGKGNLMSTFEINELKSQQDLIYSDDKHDIPENNNYLKNYNSNEYKKILNYNENDSTDGINLQDSNNMPKLKRNENPDSNISSPSKNNIINQNKNSMNHLLGFNTKKFINNFIEKMDNSKGKNSLVKPNKITPKSKSNTTPNSVIKSTIDSKSPAIKTIDLKPTRSNSNSSIPKEDKSRKSSNSKDKPVEKKKNIATSISEVMRANKSLKSFNSNLTSKSNNTSFHTPKLEVNKSLSSIRRYEPVNDGKVDSQNRETAGQKMERGFNNLTNKNPYGILENSEKNENEVSGLKSDEPKPKVLFKVNVNIDRFNSSKIAVKKGDNLYMVVQKFAVKNKLNELKKEKIYEVLKSTMEQYQKNPDDFKNNN